MQKSELTGIVLAGGLSRRMGRDKGMLSFREKPMVEYPLQLLKNYCDTLFISSSDVAYQRYGWPVVADHYPGKGPLAGIHACLKESTTEWNVVVACDVPLLTDDVLERLLQHTTSTSDAVVAAHDGYIEPLIGLYHRRLLPQIEEALHSDRLKVHDFLYSLNLTTVNMDDFSDKPFHNVNTPADL